MGADGVLLALTSHKEVVCAETINAEVSDSNHANTNACLRYCHQPTSISDHCPRFGVVQSRTELVGTGVIRLPDLEECQRGKDEWNLRDQRAGRVNPNENELAIILDADFVAEQGRLNS